MGIAEAFFDVLEEWESDVDPKVTDSSTICFDLSFKLGVRFGSASDYKSEIVKDKLKDRISELVNNDHMDEIFLIYALIHNVTELLSHRVSTHGDTIVFYEKFIEKSSDPDSHQWTDKLQELKDTGYHIQTVFELSKWKALVMENFNEFKMDRWRNERDRKMLHKELPKVPKALEDLTMKQLMEIGSLEYISSLSEEEAIEVRRSIENSK